jgi:branched-subunit amino acid aminotransferase/4-amino-4-deoxychorismate lyase
MKNRTLAFGEGLFETFRVYEGRRLAFVEDHLDRMAEGCRFFSFPFSRQRALKALSQVLKEIPQSFETRLRLNLISYGDHDVEKTSFQVTWEALKSVGTQSGKGVRLGLAPFQRLSRSPLVRFKTTSYLENVYTLNWARKEGLFDALFTNERGDITEGSISNVFFFNKDRIVTPPAEAGLLPGVTRKQILKVASSLGISATECTVTPEEMHQFDGAFVTNSVIEVLPVVAIGPVTYRVPDIIGALRQGYLQRLRACLFPS